MSDKKIVTSSTRKKYAVVPSASQNLLSREEMRQINRTMDSTAISASNRGHAPPSSVIPSLPFERVAGSGDDVLGLSLQPVPDNESALDIPLRLMAPEEYNLPDLEDPPNSLPLARRIGALLKGSESVPIVWFRRAAGLRDETVNKISSLGDAETRSQAALRSGQLDRAAPLLCLVGSLHYNSGNMEHAISSFEKALHAFESIDQAKGVAFCHNVLGVCNYRLGNYKVSLLHHKQQESLGGMYCAAVAQTNMGVAYAALGDLEYAVQAFEDALQSAQTSKEPMLETIALGNLGLICVRVGNMKAAQTHLEQCLENCSVAGDKAGAAICLLILGEVYSLMNDFQHALFYYEHAYRVGGEAKSADTVDIARVCIGITRGKASIRDAMVRQAAAMGAKHDVQSVVNLLPA